MILSYHHNYTNFQVTKVHTLSCLFIAPFTEFFIFATTPLQAVSQRNKTKTKKQEIDTL